MKTLSKMLENYAEVNRKIGFYGYDGDSFSSKKIKNLEEQAEKLKFDILRYVYEGGGEFEMNKYDKLIKFLRANGFICELVSFHSNALHYTIWNKSKTVIGLLSTKDSTVDNNNRYNDSILFDNYEAFNKWSQAPVQLEIVDSDEYRENLLKELEFLGSDEGYKLSNEFDYDVRFMKEYERVD